MCNFLTNCRILTLNKALISSKDLLVHVDLMKLTIWGWQAVHVCEMCCRAFFHFLIIEYKIFRPTSIYLARKVLHFLLLLCKLWRQMSTGIWIALQFMLWLSKLRRKMYTIRQVYVISLFSKACWHLLCQSLNIIWPLCLAIYSSGLLRKARRLRLILAQVVVIARASQRHRRIFVRGHTLTWGKARFLMRYIFSWSWWISIALKLKLE